MVEGTALEKQHTVFRIEGSNPSPSVLYFSLLPCSKQPVVSHDGQDPKNIKNGKARRRERAIQQSIYKPWLQSIESYSPS